MITPYFAPELAGAELYAFEVSKYLVRKDHEVRVVTKHLGNLQSFEVLNGIAVHRVRALDFYKLRSLTALPFMIYKTWQLARECDLIHAHITYPGGMIAYLIKKMKNTPYIITSQGDELLDYPELKELKYIKMLLKIALKNADHIHCISRALKESLVKHFDVPGEKITIIPNGVDLKKFNPAKKKRYDADFVFANVSRLVPKNNVRITIKAFKKVLDQFQNKKIKYIIIGDGEERKKLERLTRDLGLEENITFVGWIEHEELPPLIAGSDAFIRTSITEGLGVAFLEAMACGVPVIASKVQGILDIVKHEYNGLLVDPKNVNDIVSKMVLLVENEKLRDTLRKNGLELVKSYDWEEVCRNTEDIYKKVLK